MRQTKSEILKKAGYVPHKGRPRKYGESTVQISFRLPRSLADRLGENRHSKAKQIITDHITKNITK